MRACVLHSAEDLRVEERPPGKLAGDEVRIRFWSRVGPSILARQDSTGAFSPPEGDQSICEVGDRATATHALILLLPEGRLKLK